MKEYDVRILVGALYRGEENNPYTGDLEGDIEFNEDGLGVFDGQYMTKVVANSREEAISLAKEEFENEASYGELTDVGMDDANTEIIEVNDWWKREGCLINNQTKQSTRFMLTNNFQNLGNYEVLYNPTADYVGPRDADSALLEEANALLHNVWTDSHASECSIVYMNNRVYVELSNEYDGETATNNDFSSEELYNAIKEKIGGLVSTGNFGNTLIVAGEHIGTRDLFAEQNHELIVFIPASDYTLDTLKQKVETIAKVLDDEAYNLRTPFEQARTASDLNCISANGWETADAIDLKAIQQHFELVPLYDYMKENCDNAVGDVYEEILKEDPFVFFDLEDKEYDMGDDENENYNYTSECNDEIARVSADIISELNEYSPMVAIDKDGKAAATLLFEKDGAFYTPKELYIPSLPEQGSRMDVDVEKWNSEESLITVGNEEFRVISDGIHFKEILHQVSYDLDLIEPTQETKKYSKPMEIVD